MPLFRGKSEFGVNPHAALISEKMGFTEGMQERLLGYAEALGEAARIRKGN